MDVKRIAPKDCLYLRSAVLRDEKPLNECVYPDDSEESTFHLGAFIDGNLVSIASFYFENHPEIQIETQYRLRGMATRPEYRNQGLSSALLKTAIPLVKNNQGEILWCNARLSAKGFYEKTGFEAVNDQVFEVPEIGPHVLMLYRIP